MNPLRIAAGVTLLSASLHAWAYDAAGCAQAQANVRQLDGYLARSPTASDRQRYTEARTAQAKLAAVLCASGSGGGGSAGSVPRSPGSAGLPSVLGNVLNALPPADAYKVPEPPAGPPAPRAPSGSVTAPMTLERLPGPGQAAALERHSASGFPTDEQIGLECATSPNPSSCALVRENGRNQDPAYRRWKAEEAALQQRNIDKSLANIDTAIGAATIPVAPPPQPYDNSDPDLAKCREGSSTPWTIAGCYDLGRKQPAPPQAKAADPASHELRDKLRKALSGQDDDASGGPTRDIANEQKQIALWKQRAQARLAEALRNGATFVPEDAAARAACNGWWLYEGLNAGRCEPGRNRLVYSVDPPARD